MAISDQITRLATAKENIAAAIASRGGTVGSGDGFEDFASDVATIPLLTTREAMEVVDLSVRSVRAYSEKDYNQKYVDELESILTHY